MARLGGRRGVTASVVALLLVLSAGTAAHAAPAPDFPTWEEVEAAKADAAAAAREADRIEAILLDLEHQAAELGRTASLRAEEATVAQQALETAVARAAGLEQRAAAADERATASARRAGQVLAQLARTGGGDPTLALLLSSPGEAEEFLATLGAMERIGSASSALLERAIVDRNTADSLADEARIAEQRRAELAAAADAARVEAEAALADAEARVTAQRADADRMYAQLASLNGTTTDLERAYQEGLAWEEEQAADPTPPTPPADDPDPPAPNPPPPATDKVAGAIAFAKAQLGEPYAWGGAGPNSWDCSGLTLRSYGAVGVAIGPHGSTSQYNYLRNAGRLVAIDRIQPGDLLFYADGGSTTGTKYHVTMYLGGGQMIEAPYAGQVVRIVPIRYGDLVPYAGRPTA